MTRPWLAGGVAAGLLLAAGCGSAAQRQAAHAQAKPVTPSFHAKPWHRAPRAHVHVYRLPAGSRFSPSVIERKLERAGLLGCTPTARTHQLVLRTCERISHRSG